MKDIFNYRNKYTKVDDNVSSNKEYFDVNGEKVKQFDYILIEVGVDFESIWTWEGENEYGRFSFDAGSLKHNTFAIHPVIKYRNQLQFRDECGNWVSLDGLKFIKYNKEKVLKYLDELDEKINRQIVNDLQYN